MQFRRGVGRHLLGQAMVIGLAAADLSPARGGTLIVLNKSDATAMLIDRENGQTLATIETGVGPHEVAVSPDGHTAVVANYGSQTPGGTLTVIDLKKKAAVRTIDLESYQRPHGLVFMPDGRRLLVTAEAQRALLIVDAAAGTVVSTIDTGQQVSHMVALSPTADRAFVTNIGSGSVTAIDLAAGKAVATIKTGAQAEAIDISPDGREVWVGNRAADTISIVDSGSLEVVQTLACRSFPIRLKFTPDGRHVLVSCAKSGDVAVFDARGRTELRRIAMKESGAEAKEERRSAGVVGGGPEPIGIMIPPDGRHAYVANTNADNVTVIDLSTWRIADRLQTGRQPDGLGYSPVDLSGQSGE